MTSIILAIYGASIAFSVVAIVVLIFRRQKKKKLENFEDRSN